MLNATDVAVIGTVVRRPRRRLVRFETAEQR